MESVKAVLVDQKPSSFEDCIAGARLSFEEFFSNTIKQLLYNFPKDQTTSSGALFWSGPKRCPEPIVFDSGNELHLDYVVAGANLRAFNYGLPPNRDRAFIKSVVDKVTVPPFVPKSGVKIAVTDAEAQAQANQDSSMGDNESLEGLVGELKAPTPLRSTRLTLRRTTTPTFTWISSWLAPTSGQPTTALPLPTGTSQSSSPEGSSRPLPP